MAFPLIPFAAGIAVGALAAYGYKDETLRDVAGKGAKWLSDAVEGVYESVAGALGEVFGSAVVSAEGPAARITAEEQPAEATPHTATDVHPATPAA
jgi:hypothetical protein